MSKYINKLYGEQQLMMTRHHSRESVDPSLLRIDNLTNSIVQVNTVFAYYA